MANGPLNDGGAVPDGIGAAAQGSPAVFRLGDFELAGDADAIERLSDTVQQHISQLQSSYDQRIAALEAQLVADGQEQRKARLRAELQGRSPEQQSLILARHRQQELDEREQQIAAVENALAEQNERITDIQQLSQRWGIPIAYLEQVDTYAEAEAMAIEYYKRSIGQVPIPQGQLVQGTPQQQPGLAAYPRYDDPELDLVTAYMKRGYTPQQAVNLARQQVYGSRR